MKYFFKNSNRKKFISGRNSTNTHIRVAIAFILFFILIVAPLLSGCSTSAGTGDALNLWDAGPITLDPAISSELSSHMYIMQIFSGLVRLDEKLKVQPDIAEKWNVSDDGKSYTFFLRDDVRFHNGKALSAADVKYSLERACQPATGSNTAATYLGDIVGVPDVLTGKVTEISGVQVIDDSTIMITIDAPKAYFLSKLAYPTAFVVDKSNVAQGSEWWREPNGTGPFRLTKWVPDDIVILEPNESFYRNPPTINRLVFHLLSGMPMALYEMNEIDIAPVYEDNIDRVLDKKGPFFDELHIYPELSLYYIGFNTLKPPFDNVDIRKAFCYAVNKEKILRGTLKNMVSKADGILPPGIPGYNENVVGLEYDVQKAKDLIAGSEYGSVENLPPITITTSGWGNNIPENLGAIIQDWKQNLGVDVVVRQVEPEIFLYSLREDVDEMYMMGWVADYPDPQNFLANLFRTGAEYNTGNYSNPVIDALLDKAAIESDEATRINLYREAEMMLIEDAINTSHAMTGILIYYESPTDTGQVSY
ncbi:MAG: peptide ABC transporter substrate-binding protein [Dehalococcoidia bacterium]